VSEKLFPQELKMNDRSMIPIQTNTDQWQAVDRYFSGLLIGSDHDAVLDAALRDSEAAGLPAIQVSPQQGKLLKLLAQIQGARNILEIGTLGGYSTIWLARALPSGGRLITLELDPEHARVAAANIHRAGLSHVIEILLGPASDSLAQLDAQRRGPFDLIFIDADKPSYPDYLAWSIRLSRRGSVIIADNVVRSGAVIDASSTDTNVQGIRRFLERLAAEPRVSSTAIQTVSGKGYDGFAVAFVVQ
jgi:predicted O-methyltransferase YrrM